MGTPLGRRLILRVADVVGSGFADADVALSADPDGHDAYSTPDVV